MQYGKFRLVSTFYRVTHSYSNRPFLCALDTYTYNSHPHFYTVPSHILTDSIVGKIKEAGFEIALQKELTLSQEQAAEFYKEHEGKDYFESLCAHMSR